MAPHGLGKHHGAARHRSSWLFPPGSPFPLQPAGSGSDQALGLCEQTRPSASGLEPEGHWPRLFQGGLCSGDRSPRLPRVSQPGPRPHVPPRTPHPAGSAAVAPGCLGGCQPAGPPGPDLPGSGAPTDGPALQASSSTGPRDCPSSAGGRLSGTDIAGATTPSRRRRCPQPPLGLSSAPTAPVWTRPP